MSILKVTDLSISFGGLKAVDSLSFEVEKGQIYGLIGPNGAGKTTVFNCLSGFYRPDRGSIILEDREIARSKVHNIIGLGLARTFQNVELFKYMTVLDNLMVGQHTSVKYSLLSGMLGLPGARREEDRIRTRALEVMEFLGLKGTENLLAGAQPYGVQKLVELARALVASPRLLILDEPAAGMNNSETEVLAGLIRRIRAELGVTILLVEHDMSLVMGICEELCVLNFGKKIAQGTPAEIQGNPVVQEAYLGGEAEDVSA
jgi:branched-chain amino acid transport system ATP-binding protein